MISILHYWNQIFLKKEVIVNLSDVRQITGFFDRVFYDGIVLKQKNRKYAITIPKNSILSIEVKEK